MADADEKRGISRRTMLIGGGVGVGLLVAYGLWPRTYAPNLRTAPGENLINAFLKIGRDGRVIVVVPQVEIGQGTYTSLPQLLADELGADWRTVAVEPAPISPLYANQILAGEQAAGLPSAFQSVGRWAAQEYATRNAIMMTGGSTSIRAFGPLFREAGAGARALLQKAAADRWNADWQALDTRDGFVIHGEQRIAFGELAEAAASQELPAELSFRGGAEGRLLGQRVPRIDLPAKVDGTAQFAGDVRLPGMLFAAVRSGPPGSRLLRVDRNGAEAVHGALAVFQNPEWAGVAATNQWAAGKALEELRPQFETPRAGASSDSIMQALEAALAADEGSRAYAHGDIRKAFEPQAVLGARYAVAPAPNAPLETLTATARMTGDRLEIWAPTQAPGLARNAAARAVGLNEAQVTLYPMLVGSGYGRKLETQAIEQAAVMAVQLARPVQLSWSRIEEIRQDTFRPPAIGSMTASLGEGGVITGWQARIATPHAAAQTAERLGLTGLEGGGAAVDGAVPPYSMPAVAVDHLPAEIGIRTGIWRSGAHSYSCFFTECFIDELAQRVGVEPLSFRMQMLGGNPRLARCLSTAAALGGWDGGNRGSSLGLAAHSAFGSHIALVTEVEVTRDQKLRVLRAVAAVDAGRIVHPEIVRQLIEGGIVYGIAGATGAPLIFQNGVPTARTIADLSLPLLKDAPEVMVEIVESQEEPGGVTELAVPPVAPAIANALHALTGRRLRNLPLAIGVA